jgi:hypothetical protein
MIGVGNSKGSENHLIGLKLLTNGKCLLSICKKEELIIHSFQVLQKVCEKGIRLIFHVYILSKRCVCICA